MLVASGVAAHHGHFGEPTISGTGLNSAPSGQLTPEKTTCPICSFSQQMSPAPGGLSMAPPLAVADRMAVAAARLPTVPAFARCAARAPPIVLDIIT